MEKLNVFAAVLPSPRPVGAVLRPVAAISSMGRRHAVERSAARWGRTVPGCRIHHLVASIVVTGR